MNDGALLIPLNEKLVDRIGGIGRSPLPSLPLVVLRPHRLDKEPLAFLMRDLLLPWRVFLPSSSTASSLLSGCSCVDISGAKSSSLSESWKLSAVITVDDDDGGDSRFFNCRLWFQLGMVQLLVKLCRQWYGASYDLLLNQGSGMLAWPLSSGLDEACLCGWSKQNASRTTQNNEEKKSDSSKLVLLLITLPWKMEASGLWACMYLTKSYAFKCPHHIMMQSLLEGPFIINEIKSDKNGLENRGERRPQTHSPSHYYCWS